MGKSIVLVTGAGTGIGHREEFAERIGIADLLKPSRAVLD